MSEVHVPPSLSLLLLEGRAAFELGLYVASYPLHRLAPSGDGHAVLVLPGLGGDDWSTLPLRTFLGRRSFRAHGWGLGRNVGPGNGLAAKLRARFETLHAEHGKVSLVGWSLGGIYARELAKRYPEAVRQVITLCSPFAGDIRGTNVERAYRWLSKRAPDDASPASEPKADDPLPVPTTAIFTRSDGIVAWQGCLERSHATAENIEIVSSHCGAGHHPAALYAIADRLAQPADHWAPFAPRGRLRALYRSR